MMQKHTGGVKGTILARGECPVCHRSIAGGYMDRAKREVCLREHNKPDGSHCRLGSGAIVTVDYELMAAYSRERQAREACRRVA